MTIQPLVAQRVRLVPATYELISAEIANPALFSSLLQAQVGPEWPPGEYDLGAQTYFQSLMKEDEEKYLGWLVWYVLEKIASPQPAPLIGAAGYFGPPDEHGYIEVGFSVSPQARNKGYAAEIVSALVQNGLRFPNVNRVLARTSPENSPANRVLQKCGFQLTERDETNRINKYHFPKPE